MRISKIDKCAVIDKYNSGLSVAEVGKIFGVSAQRISFILRQCGIEIKHHGSAAIEKTADSILTNKIWE